MTAIAIWYNEENKLNPSVWVTADSRVSSQGGVLIEDAAKVFSLPIICRAPGPSGFFTETVYSHSYGFCFAGSTLMGQNLYLSLLPLLSELVVTDQYPPSMEDVAKYVQKYLVLAFDDFKIRVGQNAMVEVSIFGWCSTNKRIEIYHLFPKLKNGIYEISTDTYSNLTIGDFIYLGDNKIDLQAAIESGFSATPVPGRPTSRSPRYIIEDYIEDENYNTIGGDILLGIGNKSGFRQYSICKPRVVGQPEAYISYLGREISDDIRFVGDAIVGGSMIV